MENIETLIIDHIGNERFAKGAVNDTKKLLEVCDNDIKSAETLNEIILKE